MAFYFVEYWHFPIMMMLMMLLSSVTYFLFPRFPFYIVPIGSGLIGYVYALMANLKELSLYMVIVYVYAAIVPIIIIEFALFVRRKADKLEKQNG